MKFGVQSIGAGCISSQKRGVKRGHVVVPQMLMKCGTAEHQNYNHVLFSATSTAKMLR